MVNNEIIGYSFFKNKAGEDRLVIDVVKSPSEFDIKYGRVGMKVESIWVPATLAPKFSPSIVGKKLKCAYEISGRYANVVDVSFE